jgi:hypothetical protein
MDCLDKIIAFEQGELEDHEIIAMFQDLLDSETVWQLQGSYGRMAQKLLDTGHIAYKN